MRRLAVLALLLLLTGCALLPDPLAGRRPDGPHDRDPARVGPEYRLGPVPSFGADPEADGGFVVFFRTQDGWCTRHASGMTCQGGDPKLPQGFLGITSTMSDGERLCIESVTGHDVVSLRVSDGVGEAVDLEPLKGSAQAPVNVFSACWRPAIDPDTLTATAFDANGDRVPSGFPG